MGSKCSIYIGTDKIDTDIMTKGIKNDIDFLSAKILYVKGQSFPNIEVLQTYQAMLDSRYSVLEWITSTQQKAPDERITARC